MGITQSITEGRVFKAEKGNKCQQASGWLPGEHLIWKAGAEWAAWGSAKLSQGGVHEKEAGGIISFPIKIWSAPKTILSGIHSACRLGAGIPEAGLLAASEGVDEGPSLVN